MKRTLLWAVAALALAACTAQEAPLAEDALPEGYKVLTVQAGREAVTRTSYAGEVSFSWSVGDRISVLCNDGSQNFWQTFTATTAARTSKFTANVPQQVQLGPLNAAESPVALFPASEDHVYNGPDAISFAIPAERDYRAASGGHPSADIPMFAWGASDGSYQFTHLTGAAKFSFVNVPCAHVKFTFANTGSARLNGLFQLQRQGNDLSMEVVSATDAAEKTVSYYADVTDGSVSFYLPCPKSTLWAWNHVILENADTGEQLYANTKVKDITLVRKQVSVVAPLDVSTGQVVKEEPKVNVQLSFTESDTDIANPERGLYKMVEFKYHKRDDNENPTSSYTSATTSLTDDYDANGTLVMTLFYLFDFVESDHISDAGLSYVRSVFSQVRSKGKKAIVRFAYNNRHPSSRPMEPTLEQIQQHLQDLAPVLADYEDVIYVVQAGFIGTYGEWYYTSHFSRWENDKEYRDFSVSSNKVTNYENRAAVLDALLAAVPQSRQIAVRTPFYKRFYLSPNAISSWTELTGFGTDANARIAFHNDAFLYGGEDMGTFKYSADRPMWKQQGSRLINGGEAPYSSSAVSGMEGYTFDNVRAAIYDYHYSYLHHDTGYHTKPNSTSSSDGSTLMRHWHQQGWMPAIKKMLGYRLYLTEASLSGEGTAGSALNVSFTLANSGSTPIINARPMKLVLLRGGSPVQTLDLEDPRTVESCGSKQFTASLVLSQDLAGGDQLALWLPDAAPGLQSRSVYSVHLANDTVTWKNGYNIFYTF